MVLVKSGWFKFVNVLDVKSLQRDSRNARLGQESIQRYLATVDSLRLFQDMAFLNSQQSL